MDKLSIHSVSEGEHVAVLLWKAEPAGMHWERVGTNIYTCVYIYIHTYVCDSRLYIYIYMYIMYVCVYIYIYTRVCIYIYTYHAYIYICISIYTHTYVGRMLGIHLEYELSIWRYEVCGIGLITLNLWLKAQFWSQTHLFLQPCSQQEQHVLAG